MTAENRIERMEARIREAGELAAAFARDPHRPAWHFTPPAAWMNDINGALYWKGRYHIFYQLNPDGAYWNRIQWGHASSADLVHWVHHPVALTPEAEGPDRIGCFSGGALVDKEGVPTLIYYGNPDGLCLARSSDDLLLEWTKDPGNPVIPQPQEGDPGFGRYTIHDPCGWLEGGLYYAAVNKRDPQGQGDGAYLFRSQDLRTWEFAGLFYQSRREWTEGGEDCAVPDFFPLGGRHMLLFCSHLQGTQYYIGEVREERFYPDDPRAHELGRGTSRRAADPARRPRPARLLRLDPRAARRRARARLRMVGRHDRPAPVVAGFGRSPADRTCTGARGIAAGSGRARAR